LSRFSFIARHPRRSLTALATLLVAVGVVAASGADFSSSSSNATNTFTAGVLHHSNTQHGNVFDSGVSANFSGIKPGFGTDGSGTAPDTSGGTGAANTHDNYGQVVIANDGNSSQTIALAKSVTTNAYSGVTPSPSTVCGGACSALGGALKVRIVKDGDTTPVYDGVLSSLSASTFDASVSYATSDSHTYDMYFYLPQGTGNAYQGGDAKVTLNWTGS
jgi:hypothetical protein